jgi:hypothetical protein
MESVKGRKVVVVDVRGHRVHGVVFDHRSEDVAADASVDYGDQWFVRYDRDQEPDPGEGGFYFRKDMEFSD